MATTAFADLAIAVCSDLQSELASLDLIAVAEPDVQSLRIGKAGDRIKRELKRDLQQVLPTIFSNSFTGPTPDALMGMSFSDWLTYIQVGWNEIDTILDKIANPEDLKDCYVAGWKWKLYTVQWEDMLSSDSREAFSEARDYWENQYHDLYDKSWKLLRFDLNNDGVVTPSERANRRNTIRRV